MNLWEELQEVEYDIRMIKAELQHPWDNGDKDFLETELEKMLAYKHRIINRMKEGGDDA